MLCGAGRAAVLACAGRAAALACAGRTAALACAGRTAALACASRFSALRAGGGLPSSLLPLLYFLLPIRNPRSVASALLVLHALPRLCAVRRLALPSLSGVAWARPRMMYTERKRRHRFFVELPCAPIITVTRKS